MNKLIKEQLDKTNFADLSNYDENTCTYFIKKRVDIKLVQDHCYLIELKATLFDNQALVVNWNQNNMPKVNALKIEVCRLMGDMVKVNGIGWDSISNKDLNYYWTGWLTIKDIKVIQEI